MPMELYTNFTFHENISSLNRSTFILRYVRAKMIVHASMIEPDQPDNWYEEKNTNCENVCTKSMDSCFRVISQILAEGDIYKKFA